MVELSEQSGAGHAHIGESDFGRANRVLAQGGDLAYLDTGQFGVDHEGTDTQLLFP